MEVFINFPELLFVCQFQLGDSAVGCKSRLWLIRLWTGAVDESVVCSECQRVIECGELCAARNLFYSTGRWHHPPWCGRASAFLGNCHFSTPDPPPRLAEGSSTPSPRSTIQVNKYSRCLCVNIKIVFVDVTLKELAINGKEQIFWASGQNKNLLKTS